MKVKDRMETNSLRSSRLHEAVCPTCAKVLDAMHYILIDIIIALNASVNHGRLWGKNRY